MSDSGGSAPSARVSLDAIYQVVQGTSIAVAEIRGSLNLIAVERRNDADTIKDHENRLRLHTRDIADLQKAVEMAQGVADGGVERTNALEKSLKSKSTAIVNYLVYPVILLILAAVVAALVPHVH